MSTPIQDHGEKRPHPPSLPSRDTNNESVSHFLPAYSSPDQSASSDQLAQPWSMTDPRSNSQESLFSPVQDDSHDRRTLLAIYIHGFMGDETSFRSFPAHVHNLLCILLADSHVIHTKIYPRYRSKRNISFARDNFSKWLEPHEGPDVDVILFGHSMGGLVAAEVAVMKASPPSDNALKHRVLGTVNFDVPFLGMHPGIIKSGLASLFAGSDEPPKDQFSDDDGASSVASASQSSAQGPSRVDTLWEPSRKDPNFNPSFQNDVKLTFREGWRAAWHFIDKHSDDLRSATKQLISSHIEFGGAMANYPELKARYGRLRALEEEDENIRSSLYPGTKPPSRVRFLNYYTTCTGKLKKPKSHPSSSTSTPNHSQLNITRMTDRDRDTQMESEHQIAVEAYAQASLDRTNDLRDAESAGISPDDQSLGKIRSLKTSAENARYVVGEEVEPSKANQSEGSKSRNPSELSHGEREKLRLKQEEERMAAESRRLRGENTPEPQPREVDEPPQIIIENDTTMPTQSHTTKSERSASVISGQYPESMRSGLSTTTSQSSKPLKERRFCNLPPEDSRGNRDPCWIKVFMPNADEVSAHCGLFFIDDRYERLVGEVASRVEEWILQDKDVRLVSSWK